MNHGGGRTIGVGTTRARVGRAGTYRNPRHMLMGLRRL